MRGKQMTDIKVGDWVVSDAYDNDPSMTQTAKCVFKVIHASRGWLTIKTQHIVQGFGSHLTYRVKRKNWRPATPAEIAAGHRIDEPASYPEFPDSSTCSHPIFERGLCVDGKPSAFIEHCQQCADEVASWPEDKKKAASGISVAAFQSALLEAKENLSKLEPWQQEALAAAFNTDASIFADNALRNAGLNATTASPIPSEYEPTIVEQVVALEPQAQTHTSSREAFERSQATEIKMDYSELKHRLDEHERILGYRYGERGQLFNQWTSWDKAWQHQQKRIDALKKQMVRAGFTDNGGYLLKPPIGMAPDYIRGKEIHSLVVDEVICGFDPAAPVAERTEFVGQCQHGTWLYGASCIQCSREGEQ